MLRTLELTLLVGGYLLCAHAQEQAASFVLHVTHVKSEDMGEKPTQNDCTKMPCTTMIVTVEGYSVQTDFVLECKQWVSDTKPLYMVIEETERKSKK